MFRQFKFEESLYQKLERIPLSTQYKLEMLGITLPVENWGRLAPEVRQVLCHLSIRSRGERECYGQFLAYVLQGQKSSLPLKTAPPSAVKKSWEELSRLPAEVAQKMKDLNLPLFWPEWVKLDDMERYALHRLCRENTDGASVRQAVQEFLGLTPLPSSASKSPLTR